MELKNIKLLMLGTPSPSTRNTYPKDVMEKAVADLNEKRKDGVMGELRQDMVLSRELTMEQQLTVEMERVSHHITNIRVEGDFILGDVTVLDTTYGNILKTLLPQCEEDYEKTDVQLGFTFGMRSLVDYKGISQVVNMCQIITFDAIYVTNNTLQ